MTTMTATSAIALDSVSKGYGRGDNAVRALEDVSLEFPSGSFTAIMGPSGSGKTTLLQCAAGPDRPDSSRRMTFVIENWCALGLPRALGRVDAECMGNHLHEDSAIRVRGLRRSYGHGASAYEAVRGVDLDVPTGSITALLGTNGAGKTSTLEVIEGLAPATEGEISVLGLHPVADRAVLRRRTGVLLQRSGFSGDLTVRETLRLWSATVTSPRPVEVMA